MCPLKDNQLAEQPSGLEVRCCGAWSSWFWIFLMELLCWVLEHALGSCCWCSLTRNGDWWQCWCNGKVNGWDLVYETHVSNFIKTSANVGVKQGDWILVPWLDKPIKPPTRQLFIHVGGNKIKVDMINSSNEYLFGWNCWWLIDVGIGIKSEVVLMLNVPEACCAATCMTGTGDCRSVVVLLSLVSLLSPLSWFVV